MEISFNSVSSHLLHFWKNILLEIVLLPHKIHVQVPLELSVRQFIPRLVPTIILPILLNRIVCQVYVSIAKVLYVKLVRACPYVPLRIPVCFE